ncbi:hypothetical protein PJF56_00620 [Roseofilum sp. BLCC_M91]|uniref:Uncharacterized protein n=1 Tax=Roseofilum halophilum BLCC-M91 TaxID=3022259 RepID=A0ABT7BDV0_9CYAN|nr:hypothetical protein [Roseofilum halophilum]MDJ1177356.1 hypothetical protein [Roseofilum halophilum BLCC-M91]
MIELNGLIFGLFLWIAYSWVLLQLFSPRDRFAPQNLAYDHGGTTIAVECQVVAVADSFKFREYRRVRGNRYLRSRMT